MHKKKDILNRFTIKCQKCYLEVHFYIYKLVNKMFENGLKR